MAVHKKCGGARVSEDGEDQSRRQRLQAILLADSFATKFRPVTLERPKVLLPIVNTPMIDYTLAWLEFAGIEEVFVFCSAHSMQIIEYLEKSEWHSHPSLLIKTIESHKSISAGDALRYMYEQQTETSQIQGDFVLVSGDTVSNMPLADLIQEHRDRKKKDEKAIMTMVIKQSKSSSLLTTHQSRLGTDQLFIAVDPLTKQLLHYEEDPRGSVCLEKSLLDSNPSVLVCNDMQDCYIDICSPEVLSLFEDNFDYQHLRRHFVKGVLVDDIMGYKIFTHEIHSSYAARIDNFRSYDTVSKDIIQRWTFPFVPDINFSRNRSRLKLGRQGIYRASDTVQSRSADVGASTVIGYGTKIGNESKILNSVIGDGCSIGSNVVIEGSYIWNNVTIEDGCEIKSSVVCDDVIIRAGAVLQPGVVLSFKVIVGPKIVVPEYSKVSLHEQPTTEDSDDELEYADSSSRTADHLSGQNLELVSKATELGLDREGYIWEICEGANDEERRHSVAPIPKVKLSEITQPMDDGDDTDDESVVPASGELKSDADSINTDMNDPNAVYYDFEKEVEGTFLRAIEEKIELSNVTLEINGLRLSYNMESADCAGATFYSMMKLAVDTPHSSVSELFKNAANIIAKWKKLLLFYLKKIDEQIEVIMKFEEMCQESARELGPLFMKILQLLYEEDVLQEDAILRWAEEKAGADEADKVYLRQCEAFITWLKEASEEEDEENEEEEEEEEEAD